MTFGLTDQVLVIVSAVAVVIFAAITFINYKINSKSSSTPGQSSFAAPVAVTLTVVQDVRTEVLELENKLKNLGSELDLKIQSLSSRIETDVKSVETKVKETIKADVAKVETLITNVENDATTYFTKQESSLEALTSSTKSVLSTGWSKLKAGLIWLKS